MGGELAGVGSLLAGGRVLGRGEKDTGHYPYSLTAWGGRRRHGERALREGARPDVVVVDPSTPSAWQA